MTDPNQTAAAPAAATQAPAAPAGVVQRPAAPAMKAPAHSTLITNPLKVVDENAPVVAEPLPETLPESTLAEMEAGRKALGRHKPVSTAPKNETDKV